MLRHRMDAKLQILARVPFFSGASAAEHAQLAQATDIVSAEPGATLVAQGRAGHEFFVILEGTAEVRRDGRPVATLGPGECFGELALLDSRPRSASVVARSRMSLVVMEGRSFRALLTEAPAFSNALFTYLAERLRAADDKVFAG